MDDKENLESDPVSAWVRRTKENSQLIPEAVYELVQNEKIEKNDKRFLSMVQNALQILPNNEKKNTFLEMIRSRNFFRLLKS